MSKSGEWFMETYEQGNFYPDDSDYEYEMWLKEQESAKRTDCTKKGV